jgi:hypothetical protein
MLRRLTLVLSGMLVLSAAPVFGQIRFPPEESDWQRNKLEREDPRPLELGTLLAAPIMDGMIAPSEWAGATEFIVRDGSKPAGRVLGRLLMGWYNGQVYSANDWTMNNDPDPMMGGGNAWRIGTALGPGPANEGTSSFFDVFVDVTLPGIPQVMSRMAAREDDLQLMRYMPTSPGITAGAAFNGANWQYELGLGPGFPPLPVCWYWSWQQLDPNPQDGIWVPVYDGSLHVPEPGFYQMAWLLLLSGLSYYRLRNRAAM